MHLTLSPARTTRKAAAAAHARSASEPTHPALAHLDGAVRALRAWSCCGVGSSSGYGLALLQAVLAALGELLATPRAAAALHDAGDDQAVLDAFLELADAYGTFGAALLAAKQSVADAEAGARRGDAAAVAAAVRAHRRTEKEFRHLAAAMRHASRHAAAVVPNTSAADATGNAEVMISVVAEATVASAAIFSCCAAMSPDVSAIVQTAPSHKWLARLGVAPVATKVAPEMGLAALERLEELEECLAGLESESEKVFRMLLQARVLLLNIHNPL